VKVADVIIVGGGVIGASIAFELAAEKLDVLLIDGQQPAREASWAAAGMLSPGPDSPDALPLVPLAKESMRLYPEFIASVEELSGKTTAFARKGVFEVFTAPNGESERDKMVAQYQTLGLSIEPVATEVARKAEPALGPAVRAAAWLPEEATLDPRMLMDALLAALQNRGVEILGDSPVSSVMLDGNHCTGVVTHGRNISAKCIVVAAGCFSAAIDWIGCYAPTRPIRGQLLALESKSVILARTLRSNKAYLVPRPNGRIIAGSTLEDAGFEKHVTPAGVRKILDGVLELAPPLANAQLVDAWAGLRPGTPDHLPILGPTDIRGLYIATGHYRNGILLAPATAKLLRRWILGGKPELDMERFSPLRFGHAKSFSTKIATAIS
jgi:glycine oxidase